MLVVLTSDNFLFLAVAAAEEDDWMGVWMALAIALNIHYNLHWQYYELLFNVVACVMP
jgi:hypothetical protein